MLLTTLSRPPRSSAIDARSSCSISPWIRSSDGIDSRKTSIMRSSSSTAVMLGNRATRCSVIAPCPGPSSTTREPPSPEGVTLLAIFLARCASTRKFWPRDCLALGRPASTAFARRSSRAEKDAARRGTSSRTRAAARREAIIIAESVAGRRYATSSGSVGSSEAAVGRWPRGLAQGAWRLRT